MSLNRTDLNAIADDYVLGLLGETEAELFEELLARDPALEARVAALRDGLLPLDLSAPKVDLPDDFMDRLRERIAAEPAREDAAPRGVTITPVTPQADNLPQAPRTKRRWLIAAGIIGLAVGLGTGSLRPTPEPRVVAVLMNASGEPQAVIEDYGNRDAKIRFVADVTLPSGKTIQAWTLPSPETGPVSLGTLDRVAPAVLTGPDLPAPAPQQLYEITLEPAGGSPTGRPTGPILGKGFAHIQS
ncbi:anti-sigma factor [Thioclava sp. F36-7]|uniref:anti-sigma factor n=1 Tax=Thioclava sp. F36-7 TaxID=1915317 RepID=UPI0009969737|nr:anti-sigma factor [Thioclava sp. F36-7]OOY10276.1 hypothetical protein BMI89_05675 [Thioclava sp. F36-7]